MFENLRKLLKKFNKKEEKAVANSKEAAKERLHLVLMQDRANVSADFLELMKQEIIEVIKKYIDIDEKEIDVRLTNKENSDGTNGAPALYANIPIINIKNEARKIEAKETKKADKEEVKKEEIQTENENNEENDTNTSLNEDKKENNTENENKKASKPKNKEKTENEENNKNVKNKEDEEKEEVSTSKTNKIKSE